MSTQTKCESCLVFTSLKEGDYFVVNTPCGHIFHYECVRDWLSQSAEYSKCPRCQCAISLQSVVKLHLGVSPVEVNTPNKLLNFKFVVLGDSKCGKTSLLHQYAKETFSDATDTTIGCDLYFKNVEICGKIISLRIWDSAGQERFNAITPNFMRNAHGVFVVYDITNSKSIENINKWFNLIHDYAPTDVAIMLCGNKCDLEDSREIPKEKGEEMAQELGINFLETSAKEAHNVVAAFRTLAAQVLEGMHRAGATEGIFELSQEFETEGTEDDIERRSRCGC